MVKINNLFLLLSTITSWKLVAGEIAGGKCKELDEYIDATYNETVMLSSCILDEKEENIYSVKLSGDVILQSVIDKLSTYPSINEVQFSRFDEYPEDLNFESLHLSVLDFYDIKYGRKTNKFRYHQIPGSVIKTMKNIDKIYMEGYNITQNTIDAFGSLTKTKEVKMYESAFDKNLDFSNFKHLTSLALESYFSSAAIDTFSESFCKLKNLKELSLPSGNLKSIPKCIKNLRKLQSLDLSLNELTSIPKEIGELSRLKELILEYNEITTLPRNLEDLSKLEYLNLDVNKLNKIPSLICEFDRLKTLKIKENEISKIPSCIEDLSNLKILDLSENKITAIPSTITELRKLEELNMRNNQIQKIPTSIKNLVNLKILDLSYNKITVVPEVIGKLKNLVELILNDNLITKFPKSIGQLSNLETLKLNYNKIDDIIPESYNKLEKLTHVVLNNNYNIRGRTLTNPNLFLCYYTDFNEITDDFCLDPNSVCVPYGQTYREC